VFLLNVRDPLLASCCADREKGSETVSPVAIYGSDRCRAFSRTGGCSPPPAPAGRHGRGTDLDA
jgi:hypothetical protein